MSKTPFSEQCIILHDLYMHHQGDDDWHDFFATNDLGIPLAVLTVMGGARATDQGEKWIGDTFDSFCEALGIEDTGFSTIDEMMPDAAE